jgi:peptidyl-prolyl cis-trans isomerase SurA
MKSKNIFLASTVLALIFAAAAARAEIVDKVVAVVNEEPVMLFEVDRLMAANLEEIKKAEGGKERADKFQSYRSMALDRLIGDKLLDQQMNQMKLQVTDEDVKKAAGNIMQRNSLSQEELTKQLASKGLTYDQYLVDLKSQLKKVKFVGQVIAPRIKVTDADLDEFFAAHSEQFGRFQSVQMAQIILALPAGAGDAELAQSQARAQEVIQKAKKGDNFEELGKKYSVSPGTAVPTIYQVSQLAPAITEALSELKPGDVSQPVRTELGLHVVKLFERKTLAGDEYQAVREQLREKVFQEKVQEELEKYVNELKGKSYIQVKSVS